LLSTLRLTRRSRNASRGWQRSVLSTYEYIIKDRPILSKIKWIHMIIGSCQSRDFLS
jgi:hypothetical protein